MESRENPEVTHSPHFFPVRSNMARYYPESKVEIDGFAAKKYDALMDIISFGMYERFLRSTIENMEIDDGEAVVDLGCGTGRNACLMRSCIGEKGYLLGLDISDIMKKQFEKKCLFYGNVDFKTQRIDQPFKLDREFDRAFIGFVLHGFPQEVRRTIAQNVHNNLKPGGKFCIWDFNEFSLKEMPFYYRIPFKTVECVYAFDFIKRDWKSLLTDWGFGNFRETAMFKGYARLLIAEKQ